MTGSARDAMRQIGSMVLRRALAVLIAASACGCAPSTTPTPTPAESERGVEPGAVLQIEDRAGRNVRVVAGDAPGESELLVGDRALAPHPGPDELPLLLDDGAQVVFVSGRSGVASLWRVDVDGGGLLQLTNRGQRPGHLDDRFVPPPARSMRQEGDDVVYDDGSGRVRRVNARVAAAPVVIR